MGKKLNLVFDMGTAELTDVREVNSSFAVGRLRIMYTGFNRNGSHISRDAVEAAIPSLYNVPIVAHYSREANRIGGHDVAFEPDSEGMLDMVSLTTPCGVISDHTDIYFETALDTNGREREYLVADGVILWKRQEVCRHIIMDKNGITGHSMEIEVLNGNYDEHMGCFYIDSFQFEALCLLGDGVEPCFEGSSLTLYAANGFRQEMEQMMQELKRDYALIVSASPRGADTEQKGGSVDMFEEKKEEAAVEEVKEELEFDGDGAEGGETGGDNGGLLGAVEPDPDGKESPTGDGNSDPGTSEPGASDPGTTEPGATEPGATQTGNTPADGQNNGGNGNGNGGSNDGGSEPDASLPLGDQNDGSDTDVIMKKLQPNFEQKYAEAMEQIASMQAELDELRAYRDAAEYEKARAEKDAVLKEFDDLADTPEFSTLRDEMDKFSADELREKCYAMRGRMFSAEKHTPSPKFTLHRETMSDDAPYGGIVEKYTNK